MKQKTLLCILFLICVKQLFAQQTPQAFNWQGVVTGAAGSPLVDANVGVQFILHQDSPSGTAVYTESQLLTTNNYGLVSATIGIGSTSDDFTAIEWNTGTYFLEIGVDILGGSSYSSMGTTQLISVPYALQANSALKSNNLTDEDEDTKIEFFEDVQDTLAVTIDGNQRILFTDKNIEPNFLFNNLYIGKTSGANYSGSIGNNLGLGDNALQQITTGFFNIGIGTRALKNLTNGKNNIAIGGGSLENITTGDFNIAIGALSLQNVALDARNNIGVGQQTLENARGDNNVAVGYAAGSTSVTSPSTGAGYANVYLGFNAGFGNEGDGNVFIGNSAGSTNFINSNTTETLIIDNGWADPLIQGHFLNETLDLNANVSIRDVLTVASGLKIGDGTTVKKLETGRDTVTSGTGIVSHTITFSNSFNTTPQVNVTVNTDTANALYLVNTTNITTTQATITIYRVDNNGGAFAGAVNLDYIIWE